MKTTIDNVREKLSSLKAKDVYLPERCKAMEDIIFDLLNEVEAVQRKIEKIHRVLGE